MAKFSIITVSLNSATTIRDAIESVLTQDYPDIEYLVVDGASQDDTMQIVGEYADRITRSVSVPDDNVYDAMNTGIKLATGDIVGFINSDDFYASSTAISSVATIFERTGADTVHGDLCYVAQKDVSRVIRYWCSSRFTVGSFARGWCPPHPTFFVRRSVYQRLGGFDPEFPVAGDVELMMRFLETHRVSSEYLPIVLVKMRMGGQTNRSISNVVRQNMRWMAALRKHGLDASWPLFLAHKSWSRARQFVARPVSG